MSFIADNALIVQSDRSVLLEVYSPKANQAREAIAPFTELIKSPEHIHAYRITPLSIWNARAAGVSIKTIISALQHFSKFPVPEAVIQEIVTLGERYGLTVIERSPDGNHLLLRVADKPLSELLSREEKVAPLLHARISETEFQVDAGWRGLLKQALLNSGYPAEDLAGYIAGERMPINLRARSLSGKEFIIRNYQQEAANAFYQSGSVRGGSGVVVLPCGAGKTIVGLALMAAIQESVLVLTSSQTSIHQWQRELIDKTDISPEMIAEYSGETKATGPITLATYQILTYRPSRNDKFPHLSLFRSRSWGLIIYDEVHLLPAPVFRIAAEL